MLLKRKITTEVNIDLTPKELAKLFYGLTEPEKFKFHQEVSKLSNPCKKCEETGKVRYYHDAGDHFGAGTAPNSEWREVPCPEYNKEK